MYTLQRYKSIRETKHECPACHSNELSFVYYVNENGVALAPTVGRCDHETNCGYHYKPKDFFRDHGLKTPKDWAKPILEKPKELMFIDEHQVGRFRSNQSNLCDYLAKRLGNEQMDFAAEMYQLGALANGSTIFWQIDHKGKVRTGKVMAYDSTGHRIKGVVDRITWMHSLLKKDGFLKDSFEATQCLFGEHLLHIFPDKQVLLVESEKTAIVCSIFFPEYLWLATGGKNGLTPNKMPPLAHRDVYVVPDADAMEQWSQIVDRFKSVYQIQIHPDIHYTAEQVAAHADWADLLLQN